MTVIYWGRHKFKNDLSNKTRVEYDQKILTEFLKSFTFAFQSQVCLSKSKASPEGHFTLASL